MPVQNLGTNARPTVTLHDMRLVKRHLTNLTTKHRPARVVAALAMTLLAITTRAQHLSDTAIDAYNLRVGTQTFGVKYQFTTNTALVETARSITNMGSDIVKFFLGRGLASQYRIPIPNHITNLAGLAEHEPSCREVLDMPFKHIFAWAYPMALPGDTAWRDGYSAHERSIEYSELYALTRYLLTRYNNSGKRFFLGHWEGDWYLLPGYKTTANPSPEVVQNMIEWLNNRQKAVDDAARQTPHSNVFVFHYTEVNRVVDAMRNPASNNKRLVNAVMPFVTNLDYVSWSSYDGMNLPPQELRGTLDYIERHLPANKASVIHGKRVFIGEYGWGGSLSGREQEEPTRNYLRRVLEWGAPYALYWQLYNNEPGKRYWLVNSEGERVPCWHLHHRLLNAARLELGRFQETRGRLPQEEEFLARVLPLLEKPMPELPRIVVSNGAVSRITRTSATVTGVIAQNRYGDSCARVLLYCAHSNPPTNGSPGLQVLDCGINRAFRPGNFTATLNRLAPDTEYFYQFAASNDVFIARAPNADSFRTLP